MPLSSPKRKVSDAENKLRVLCCLDALGMATQEQLWPFVAQLELMEYIPFCMFLCQAWQALLRQEFQEKL